MLKRMQEIRFPSPRLLYYDNSCELCESPYMFMSYIEGKTYSKIKEKLSEEEIPDYYIMIIVVNYVNHHTCL
ncbi:aminoglycoside phosphotransferase [Clostridium sp. CAG:762]|nr:aminoglycoside phosphotransferase [Clostridium sp. CAG:762]